MARCQINAWKDKLIDSFPEETIVFEDESFKEDIDEEEEWEDFKTKFQRYKSRIWNKKGEPTIEQCYKNLEVPFGSDTKTARKGLRKLLLKYHPDRYPNDKVQQKRATKIAQSLTESFQIIKRYNSKKF